MNSNDAVIKTTKDVVEVETRSKKRPQRPRAILAMIDGTLTSGQFQDRALKMGVSPDILDTLQQGGPDRVQIDGHSGGGRRGSRAGSNGHQCFDSNRCRAAQNFINDTVVDAPGMRARMLALKVRSPAYSGSA